MPFEQIDTVALGYKSTIKGDFKISIDHTDGVLDTQQVFLEDKELHLMYDLKKEPYWFTTEKGVFNNRFVLRYLNKDEVDKMILNASLIDESVLVSVLNNEIKLNSLNGFIAKVSLYDVSGKLLYQKDGIAASDFVIQNLAIAHQVVVVNVVLANGQIISTKIIY